MTSLASYIPFLHPVNALQGTWYLLLLPMAFGIAVIYKALRVRRMERYWSQVSLMTVQIVLAMVALAAGLAILVQLVIPMIRA
jgi:hypothetical protein